MQYQARLPILIFASVPPPVHGQNVMVAGMLEALGKDPRFEVFHVDPGLSRRTEQVGRPEVGKVFRLLRACSRAILLRLRKGPLLFYYIPSPARGTPLVRDLLVMLLCRPFFSRRVFHWHAVGLGWWARRRQSRFLGWITRRLLGRAELSIVLGPEVLEDAASLKPRRVIVVPNGIPDPCPDFRPRHGGKHTPFEVLFLGTGSHDKGLFRAIAAIKAANSRRPGAFRLTFAGDFATARIEEEFRAAEDGSGGALRCAGFVSGAAKADLLAGSDLLCFPTSYAHEGQPLVLLEAMAFDLPIVTSRWRTIPSMLPSGHAWTVDLSNPSELVEALLAAADAPPPMGALRGHFLQHFTHERHLQRLTEALLSP